MVAMGTPLHEVSGKSERSKTAKIAKVFQLRVDLRGTRPKIWRRIVVPATIKLPTLHVVLLRAMGWQGGHLHEFLFGDVNYGRPETEWDLPDGVQDETRVSLRKALDGGSTFTWVYDYGDNWQHKIKVERAVDMGVPLDSPMCITGQGACPPEDVGGVPGYEHFLAAIADPSHPEHAELKDWCGGAFDSAAFDVAEVQQRLDEITL